MSRTRQTAADGLLAAVLFALQISLIHLPNIELVSVMVIVYTLVLGKRVLNILAVFTILEGMFHGFGIWWISYLYIWPVLAGLTVLLKKWGAPDWGYGILSCLFGFSFGFLCSLPYIAGGWGAVFAWWISGIPFDVVHGISNLVIGLVLFKPVKKVLNLCVTNRVI
ncbi:MAG: hypothetical protein HFG74_11485 [Hungatella sp.]|nr:hypothetical protein [Hungatella sp.]